MRRLSYMIANDEEELFVAGGGDDNGERGGLYYSKITQDAEVAPPCSNSKSRRSFCGSSSVSTVLSIVSSRKSFSYDKLDEGPIHLTVVKLDASVFEIEVVKMAKISDLKQAVESAFNHLPTKGLGKVSWQYVWAHFCLSFRGVKLLNDVDYIKNYGIMDGDELHFVRHVSIAYNLIKKK